MLIFKSIASPLSIHQLRLREKRERKIKLDFFFKLQIMFKMKYKVENIFKRHVHQSKMSEKLLYYMKMWHLIYFRIPGCFEAEGNQAMADAGKALLPSSSAGKQGIQLSLWRRLPPLPGQEENHHYSERKEVSQHQVGSARNHLTENP